MNQDSSKDISNKDLKIGVFLCRCGGNISDTVDMDRLDYQWMQKWSRNLKIYALLMEEK